MIMKKEIFFTATALSLLLVSCKTVEKDTLFGDSKTIAQSISSTENLTEEKKQPQTAVSAPPSESTTEASISSAEKSGISEGPVTSVFEYADISLDSVSTSNVYSNALIEPSSISPAKSDSKYIHDYEIPDVYELPRNENQTYDPDLISDLYMVDKNGTTSLMRAVRSGNDWKTKALIEAGAQVNATDKDGWTALMYAVRYQSNLQVVKLLLDNDAEVRSVNKYGTNALSLASSFNDNPEIISLLLSKYSPAEKEVQQAFVLLLTTQQSSEYTLLTKTKKFVEIGVPLNTYYEGKTPLMYAAQYCSSTKVIKLLLDNGAKSKSRSTEGKTVFEYASENKALPHDDIFWSLNKR